MVRKVEETVGMAVLIDATAIPMNRGGVGRFIDSVLPELAAQKRLTVTVVCQQRDAERFTGFGAHPVIPLHSRYERRLLRLLWEQFGLPRLARRLQVDVIFSPHYTFPLLSRRAGLVEIHDLTFFTLPTAHSIVKRVFFRSWIRLAAARRKRIVTPSEATASELCRIVHVPRRRIDVAPLAFDREVFHQPSADDVNTFKKTLSPYADTWIAFLGTLEPRKNVPALIAAYGKVADEVGKGIPPLLIAGGPGWDAQALPAIEDAVARGLDVRLLGYLPLEQLPAFLGGATVVAYPSLGEGFGLPVLEAMASGACVLTTRQLSLPEVGGEAVHYCETAVASIAKGLLTLVRDDELRRRYKEAAAVRAKEFSWGRTAKIIEGSLLVAKAGTE